jgi:hypothetical protein
MVKVAEGLSLANNEIPETLHLENSQQGSLVGFLGFISYSKREKNE